MLFERFENRPAWVRLTLLALGELIAGFFLYNLFAYLPWVEVAATFVAFILLELDNLDARKGRSVATRLGLITAVATLAFSLAARFGRWGLGNFHEEPWLRLMCTGLCLMALLIFLDRRIGWD